MTELVTKGGLTRIAGFTCLLALALLIAYPFSPGYKELQAMRRACESRERVHERLAGDLRFRDVFVTNSYTEDGARLEIWGAVYSAAAYRELRDVVGESTRETAVAWFLEAPTNSWSGQGIAADMVVTGMIATGSSPER